MSSDDSKSGFDDPALKAAACKAWGREQAPANLCRCVEGLVRTCRSANGDARGIHRVMRSWLAWPVGLAAIIALAVGIRSLVQTSPSSAPQIASVTPALPALPASLETALITTHDHCCGASNHHHIQAPIEDDAAIARAMQSRLLQAVLVARPDSGAWGFRGAAICPVGATPAGHLLFVKDDGKISIFSLPDRLMPGAKDGGHYESTTAGHPIAAFARSGGLFCLVGSGSNGAVTQQQLVEMRNQMEAAVTAASTVQADSRTAVAELSYLSHP